MEMYNYQLYFVTYESSVRSVLEFFKIHQVNVSKLTAKKDGKKKILENRQILINHCVIAHMSKILTSKTKLKVILNKGNIKKTKSNCKKTVVTSTEQNTYFPF